MANIQLTATKKDTEGNGQGRKSDAAEGLLQLTRVREAFPFLSACKRMDCVCECAASCPVYSFQIPFLRINYGEMAFQYQI